MSTLDQQIEAMEHRVLNAATIEAARHFHDQLDELVARRAKQPPARPALRAEYKRGYNSGYLAGQRSLVRLLPVEPPTEP